MLSTRSDNRIALAITAGALALAAVGCGEDTPVDGGGSHAGGGGAGGTGGSGGTGGLGGTGGEPAPELEGYPKINMLIWSGASAAWLAEFDWVILAAPNQAAEAKVLNPDLRVSATLDFNQVPLSTGVPSEWVVQLPSGDPKHAYESSNSWLGDTTDYCEPSPAHDNQTYREWIVSWAQDWDWSLVDGVNSDGMWGKIGWLGPFDIDGDQDHDQDDNDLWRDGRLALFAELRAALGDDALITMWAGHTETYWDQGGESLNGVGAENFMVYSSWQGFLDDYHYWADHGTEPHAFYVNNNYQGDPDPGAWSKDNFRFMRFGLAATLLHDGYYSYADGDGLKGNLAQNGHTWVRYYDEYDVPLGQPLGPFATLSNNVFCRFFEGGAMILNASAQDVDVTEDDLMAAADDLGLSWTDIAGEGGHYYRFAGQQNPTYNDGSVLTSINLPSKETWVGYEGPNRKGDGILLVRTPAQPVVAPVIIDTETFVTSPGADNAELDGFTGTCGQDNSVIGFRTGWGYCTDVNPLYGYAESAAGQGHSATFSAQLVHEGPYRIYEYHPEVDGWDVPHTIHHADGEETVHVDQRADVERWNLLGTYTCSVASPCQVVISNEAAGTLVAADAVRFEWAGGASRP